jgi:hypothetical protein
MSDISGEVTNTLARQKMYKRTNSNGETKATYRCCSITVDFATAASQNGLNTYKLSIHKKINIIQTATKNITYFFHLLSKSSRRKNKIII